MASIPGTAFNLTGASGSQGLLGPKEGWFVYVLPRGAYVSQDSTGTTITFDSTDAASRFAVNNWIQAGLLTANLRKVSGVGGNSIALQGAALTVSENDRIFIIGNTQPTVSGGSATYITPNTVIRQRDDDAADLYVNSMITSNADGLVQFFSDSPALYDCIIQDGNQANQGKIIDLAVGAVEGISTGQPAIFGATTTFLAGVSMNATLVVGQTTTLLSGLSTNGNVIIGGSLTVHGNAGFTGTVTIGRTVTLAGVSGSVTFGNTVTFNGAAGFTGQATFGATATHTAALVVGATVSQTQGYIVARRFSFGSEGSLISTDFALSAGWGAGASMSNVNGSDSAFSFIVGATGAGIAANPTITLTLTTGVRVTPFPLTSRATLNGNQGMSQPTIPFFSQLVGGGSTLVLRFGGTPVAGESYGCTCITVGQ